MSTAQTLVTPKSYKRTIIDSSQSAEMIENWPDYKTSYWELDKEPSISAVEDAAVYKGVGWKNFGRHSMAAFVVGSAASLTSMNTIAVMGDPKPKKPNYTTLASDNSTLIQLRSSEHTARVLSTTNTISSQPSKWEELLLSISELSADWNGTDTIAPSSNAVRDVDSIFNLVSSFARSPTVEIDDEDGEIMLVWRHPDNLGYLSLIPDGNGRVSVIAKEGNQRIVRSVELKSEKVLLNLLEDSFINRIISA